MTAITAYNDAVKKNTKKRGRGKQPAKTEAQAKHAKGSLPGVFTEKKKQLFIDLYAQGGTVAQCAAKVGVSKVTVYNHTRNDPEFKEAYSLAMQTNTDMLEDLLHSLAQGGNIAALFGTLKARRPDRWRDNFKVEHSGNVGLTTADQLEQARERAKVRDAAPVEARH